jgi:hypothetical protein
VLVTGSEWRRWDLHVHTPGTILNNRFGDWNEYLFAIEAQTAVRVIGVTDYMSITNYSKLKVHKANGHIRNIDLLIPNIEFRVAPPTEQATAVNIHVLVSPDDPRHEQEILNALGRLTWEFNGRRYSCLPDQLMALGRAFDPKMKEDAAALHTGTMQFKVDFTTLRDWYSKEPWLRTIPSLGLRPARMAYQDFAVMGHGSPFAMKSLGSARFCFQGAPANATFGSEVAQRKTVRRSFTSVVPSLVSMGPIPMGSQHYSGRIKTDSVGSRLTRHLKA